MKKTLKVFYVLILFLVFIISCSNSKTSNGKYRLMWDADCLWSINEKEPTTINDLKILLKSKFSENHIFTYEKVTCDSCDKVLKAAADGFVPSNNADAGEYAKDYEACMSMMVILNGKEANTSYIEDLKINKSIVELLPSILSGSYRLWNNEVNFNKTWKNTEEILSSKFIRNGKVLVLRTKNVDSSISLLASGDFNGDGMKDMLLQFGYGPHEAGTIFSTCLAIITRTKENGPVVILNIYDVIKGKFIN